MNFSEVMNRLDMTTVESDRWRAKLDELSDAEKIAAFDGQVDALGRLLVAVNYLEAFGAEAHANAILDIVGWLAERGDLAMKRG